MLWFGDERCVPPDDERSNYLMVKAALLDPLAASGDAPAVQRIKGELGPVAAADDYEAELRAAGPPALRPRAARRRARRSHGVAVSRPARARGRERLVVGVDRGRASSRSSRASA